MFEDCEYSDRPGGYSDLRSFSCHCVSSDFDRWCYPRSSTANMAKPELIAKPSAVLKPSFDELPRTKSKQFQTSQPFTFRQPSPSGPSSSGPSSSGTTKPSKPLKPSHQHRRHAQTSNPADPDDPDGGSPSASEDENGIKRLKPEHIKWVKALEGGEGGFSSPEFKMFEGIR